MASVEAKEPMKSLKRIPFLLFLATSACTSTVELGGPPDGGAGAGGSSGSSSGEAGGGSSSGGSAGTSGSGGGGPGTVCGGLLGATCAADSFCDFEPNAQCG